MKTFLNLLIILLVFFSIGTETYNFVYGDIHPSFLDDKSYLTRYIFYYSHFTILSNLMVGISSLILLFKPNYSNKWFRILRLDAIVCIIITCIVYNLILRKYHIIEGIMIFTNEALHSYIPFLAMLTWLLYGPRKILDKQTVIFAIFPPLIYVICIFIRGHFTNIYPYFFLDAGKLGLPQAMLNTSVIVLLFLNLEFIICYIDKILTSAEHKH